MVWSGCATLSVGAAWLSAPAPPRSPPACWSAALLRQTFGG